MKLSRTFRHFTGRPTLMAGILTALVVSGIGVSAIGAAFVRPAQAVLLGWCCGAVVYLALAARLACRSTIATMRQRADALDEGSGFIVCVTIGAALASVTAIVLDLGHLHGSGAPAAGALLLSGATLVLSWFFIHTVFAFHYAHLFYSEPKSLSFPGVEDPTYSDFMYFSLVIGMTAQVSDVTTGTAAMRWVVMTHGVIAFFFNTAVLALGVNLAASLVG